MNHSEGSGLIEILAAIMVLLLAFAAITWALPVFAEYVQAVTP